MDQVAHVARNFGGLGDRCSRRQVRSDNPSDGAGNGSSWESAAQHRKSDHLQYAQLWDHPVGIPQLPPSYCWEEALLQSQTPALVALFAGGRAIIAGIRDAIATLLVGNASTLTLATMSKAGLL